MVKFENILFNIFINILNKIVLLKLILIKFYSIIYLKNNY